MDTSARTTPVRTTLRQRVEALSQSYTSADIHASKSTVVPCTRNGKAWDCTVLPQACNNLATANVIGQHNAALGKALKSIAISDINSMRAKRITPRKLAVIQEYNNLGTFWNA